MWCSRQTSWRAGYVLSSMNVITAGWFGGRRQTDRGTERGIESKKGSASDTYRQKSQRQKKNTTNSGWAGFRFT